MYFLNPEEWVGFIQTDETIGEEIPKELCK